MSALDKLYEDIPDVTGKVAIVTGGNSGLGKEICKVLLEKGAKVYMATRSKERALEAIEEIKEKTKKDQIFYLPLDLASFSSIIEAATQFKKAESALHMLINNAGMMGTPMAFTEEGYELQWGINVVGHFLFSMLLLPVLEATAASSPFGSVRVVNMSSMAHTMAPKGGIDFQDTSLSSYYFSEWKSYGQSKLGNILFSKEFAKRYADKNILSIAVHPGVVVTPLRTKILYRNWLFNSLISFFTPNAISEQEGAYTPIFAATHPKVVEEKMNGKYLIPLGQIAKASPDAENPQLAEKLWNYLEKETSGKY